MVIIWRRYFLYIGFCAKFPKNMHFTTIIYYPNFDSAAIINRKYDHYGGRYKLYAILKNHVFVLAVYHGS